MATLGLWFGPLLAVILVAAANRWLGWFQPKSKRRIAIRRIAENLASEASHGYPWQYERFLEHYLGGRRWDEEWEKSDTQDDHGDFYDSRGPARKWWQRRSE